MIRIRANRDNFVEIHLESTENSLTFPGYRYLTITDNLNELIDVLLEAQRFMKNYPPLTQTWGIN